MRVPAPRVALIILVVALLAAGLAVVVIRAGDGGHKVAARSPASTSVPTITIAPDTTTSTAPAAPSTTQPIPSALAQTFNQFHDQVPQLRGLPWLAPSDIPVAPDADFVRQLNAVIHRDIRLDRLQGDGETWKVLKLIPQNTDYVKTTFDLYGGAVLGFYDPKTKKLLVRAGGTTLTAEQRITLAHEMDHPLTDQHFQFRPAPDPLDA